MVHQYKNNGYNILLDVNSGSVHVVDDLIYDMIPYYKEKGLEETVNLLKDKYPEQDIREAAEDLDELIKEGKLYTEDIYDNALPSLLPVYHIQQRFPEDLPPAVRTLLRRFRLPVPRRSV